MWKTSPRQGTSGRAESLAGTEPAAGVGDGGLGIEALVDQLQEAHAPGYGVAMVLQAEQVAIGRGGIDADEHWVDGLKDLVVGPDANGGQVVTSADGPSRFDGAVHDVVHGTQGDRIVEEVAKQLDHAAGTSYGRSTPKPGPVDATKPW